MATSKYKKPKNHLHREFLYLDHDTIVNSLSAMEAGQIDEIIHKANQAREGGLSGGLSAGPAEVTGGKKRTSTIEEELVRTRTVFSAFDAWYRSLDDGEALGRFDDWDTEVRSALTIGDTIEFPARITFHPVHMMFHTYLSFAELANTPRLNLPSEGRRAQGDKEERCHCQGPHRWNRDRVAVAGVSGPVWRRGASRLGKP